MAAMPETTPVLPVLPWVREGGIPGMAFSGARHLPPPCSLLLAQSPPFGTAHPSAVTSWQDQWAIHHLTMPEAAAPGG